MRGIRRIAIATVLVTAGIGSAHLGAAGAVGNPWAPGTVFVASNGRTNGFDGSVEAIPPSGSPQDLYNGAPEDVAVDALGDVFMADCNAGSVYERPAAGGLVTFAAGLSCPDAVAVDGSGNVLVGDFYDLYRYAPGGGSRTTLLTGIPPQSIAVDGHGDVYVSDGSNELAVLVGGSAPLERVATSSLGLNPDAVRVDSAGDLYMANDFGNDAVELPVGSLTPTAFGTGLNYTDGVVVDGSGSVFISDVNGSRCRQGRGGFADQRPDRARWTGRARGFSPAVRDEPHRVVGGARHHVAGDRHHDREGEADRHGERFVARRIRAVRQQRERPRQSGRARRRGREAHDRIAARDRQCHRDVPRRRGQLPVTLERVGLHGEPHRDQGRDHDTGRVGAAGSTAQRLRDGHVDARCADG